jgi:hypothetical protein
LKGIVPSLNTPFLENGPVDHISLRRMVDHNFKRILNIVGIALLMAALAALSNWITLILGRNPLSKLQFDQTGPHLVPIKLLKKNANDGKAEAQSTQSNAFPHSLGRLRELLQQAHLGTKGGKCETNRTTNYPWRDLN